MKKLLVLSLLLFCTNFSQAANQKICKTDMDAYREAIKKYPAVNLLQSLPALSKFTTCKIIPKTDSKNHVKKFVKTKGKL